LLDPIGIALVLLKVRDDTYKNRGPLAGGWRVGGVEKKQKVCYQAFRIQYKNVTVHNIKQIIQGKQNTGENKDNIPNKIQSKLRTNDVFIWILL